VQLLDRSPSGSVATPAGVQLSVAGAEVIAAAASLVDRGEALRDEHTHLVLTTTRHVADHFLPGWIAAGSLQGVRLDLVEADTLTVVQTVRAGEAVLGFTEGPAAPLGLRSVVVAREQVVPVVGRSHPWYDRRRGLTGRGLVEMILILPRRGSGSRDVVEAALAPLGLGTAGHHVEVPGTTAARLSALNGEGVAFLPRCRVEADLAAGDLAALPVRDVAIEQPVRAVWRGARPSEAPARRLLDQIRR
jgi:DNA-binding transcriptional LysR family regulator